MKRTRMNAHTDAHIRTHTLRPTHAHAHSCTYTHTHTQINKCIPNYVLKDKIVIK